MPTVEKRNPHRQPPVARQYLIYRYEDRRLSNRNGIAANQDKISTFMVESDTRIVLNHGSSTNINRVIYKEQILTND